MSLTPAGRGLGLIADARDERDRLYTPAPIALPGQVDLEPDPATPPIWNQGRLGSCTAHGTLACFLWASAKCGANDPMLSRLQLYYNTRALEGTTGEDGGGTIRDAIKATTRGIAPEVDWPYDVSRFAEQPPAQAQQDAAENLGLQYQRVPATSQGVRACLAEGFPVDIGVQLHESFEAAPTLSSGIVPIPADYDQVIGGHCMAVWGYGLGSYWQTHGYPLAESSVLYVKLRNSWGQVYRGGTSGYCLMPMELLTIDGSDFWTLRKVS